MRRRCLLLGCVAMAWLGACGAGDPALAPGCTDRDEVERALEGGPFIADCVEDAGGTPATLQELGAVLTPLAEDLEAAARDDPAAARRLGFLIGATRKGIERTDGRGAELARRIERSGASVRDPQGEAELQRGLAEGAR
jgi:hypothetical protein